MKFCLFAQWGDLRCATDFPELRNPKNGADLSNVLPNKPLSRHLYYETVKKNSRPLLFEIKTRVNREFLDYQ